MMVVVVPLAVVRVRVRVRVLVWMVVVWHKNQLMFSFLNPPFILDPPEKFEVFFYDALARHEEVSDV